MTPVPKSRLAYTQLEAALALGVHPETIRRWERAGLLKGERKNRRVYYPIEQLKKLATGYPRFSTPHGPTSANTDQHRI